MKKRFLPLGTLALLLTALGGLVALGLAVPWAFNPGSASSSSSLACSVTDTSCAGGEVEVFRMSSTSNAHAGTPAGATGYTYRVCCDGDGLGDNCSGSHDTVLALSGTNNAHVATTVGGSYTTELCLSVTTGIVTCTYDTICATSYECLATISGTTNAHVADCDGTDPYATKVCCYAGPLPVAVGGLAELPDVSGSSSSGRYYIALAGGLAAVALVALSAGGWFARRRWLG